MAPLASDEPFKSTVGIKYPKHRDGRHKTSDLWIKDKRTNDGAEGFWRIHDEIYDFSSFVNRHPGGANWLKWTEGTDITEAFEIHHLSSLPAEMLSKYYVKKAKTSRNYHFTFHENGFYKTLKARVMETLKNVPESPEQKSKIMTDLLLLAYITTALLSVILNSYILGSISGIILALVAIAAHNFFHKKDNFRMFYFDFTLMSSSEWRISHVLSHHLYTNTIADLELSAVEPFLQYLPKQKSIIHRTVSLIISPGVYIFMFIVDFGRKLLALKQRKELIGIQELLPLIIPIFMSVVGGSITNAFLMWGWIIVCGSFHFGLVGVNAAHHHPDIFHDGDTPREDHDWGLSQLDAVMDRSEINNSRFLVLTNFGDHTLHHLFPTVDHGYLPYLYPVLKETCEEFGVQFRITSQISLVVGQFLQLFRVRPNPNPPGSKKIKRDKPKSFYDKLKPYRNLDVKKLKD